MPGVAEMGRVVVAADIENIGDLWKVREGLLAEDAVRRIHIEEALVVTGATTLCLPSRYIAELGLIQSGERISMSSTGPHKTRMFGPAKLIVQGRDCSVDVMEIADEAPVLIGQIPLELFDFVVDPPGRRLIGNPAHGGAQMLEAY